jgi:transposase, IS6 family
VTKGLPACSFPLKSRPKKLAKYKSYFQYFHTAWRTLRGYEIMNTIRKGQIENIVKGDVLEQRNFVNSLFGIAV